MKTDKTLFALAVVTQLALNSPANADDSKLKSSVIQSDRVNWGYLNPLRGEQSPGAANLWGNRTQNRPTGLLVKFRKGFSSPEHIHNISYRGIVIKGQIHNDDPTAETFWLPSGSFWTQPGGGNHITSANGQTNLIYLEIDSGPYLVKPSHQHFDNKEAPLNLHISNMVWRNDHGKPSNNNVVEVTNLWGSTIVGELGGSLLKLPAEFNAKLLSNASELRVVVIAGEVKYQSVEKPISVKLLPGSYFSSSGKFEHQISTSNQTILYIRSNGQYQFQ